MSLVVLNCPSSQGDIHPSPPALGQRRCWQWLRSCPSLLMHLGQASPNSIHSSQHVFSKWQELLSLLCSVPSPF